MSRSHLVLFTLAITLLTGCISSKVATSRYKANFDFTAINSYTTFGRDSTFSDYQNINDATRNSIELAIEQVFDKIGFTYRTSENADIVIGYHLVGRNPKELSRYNKGVKYCRLCLRAGEGKSKGSTWRILPGSLILDVINTENNRSIWRSVLPLKIDGKDNSKDIQDKIYNAIDIMLKKFPGNKKLTARYLPNIKSSTEKRSYVPKLAVYNE